MAYNSRENMFLVVWSDSRDADTTLGIYGQLVSAEGVLIGGWIEILDNSTSLVNPAVAYDPLENRWLVVWENSTDDHIEGRVLNSNGVAYSSAFIIGGSATIEAWDPDVAYNLITDEFLVVWTQQVGAGTADVYARKVSDTGVADPGGSFSIAATSLVESEPAVVADTDTGRYLVVWRSNSGGTLNIFAQRLLSDGATSGAGFYITLQTLNDYKPSLAMNSEIRRAMVVWYNSDGNIYGITVSSNNTLGTQRKINSLAGNSSDPDIAYSPVDDRYLIVWQQGNNINARWADTNGASTAAQFTLSSHPTGRDSPRVAYGNQEYLAAWHDERYDDDIYGSLGFWRTSIYLPLITK